MLKTLCAIFFGLITSRLVASELETCVVEPISSKPILPNDRKSNLECSKSIIVNGAPGQFVPASFTINSNVARHTTAFRATVMSGKYGSLEPRIIDIRFVKVWYQSGSAWTSIRQDRSHATLVPELLLHDPQLIHANAANQTNEVAVEFGGNRKYLSLGKPSEVTSETVVTAISELPIQDSSTTSSLDLPADITQQVWLTFAIPSSTIPGVYNGEIEINFGVSNERTFIPIALTVYPFNLAKPLLNYSIYYRGILDNKNQGSISSELKSTKQMYAELKDMQEHGIDNPTIYQAPDSIELIATVLNLRHQAGISNDTIYWLGIQSGSNEKREGLFKASKRIFDSYGTRSLYVYATDEAEFSEIATQSLLWKTYRNLGGLIFAADYKIGLEKQYAGKVSLLISGIRPDPRSNQVLQQAGTRVFAYNQPQSGIENPEIYRRAYGVDAWKVGYDGVMDYAYQHSMGSIWNDFDHPQFRDHAFTYPTADSIIPTLAWEGFRAAIDDVRYLSTLQVLASTFASESDLKFIENLRKSTSEDLSRQRNELAGRIVSLCNRISSESAFCIKDTSPPNSPQIKPVETP